MFIDIVPDTASWLMTSLTHWSDPLQTVSWHFSFDWTVLAQQYNQDILGDIQKAFNHFVKTGQVWAFLIGIILGYMIKSFTTFG